MSTLIFRMIALNDGTFAIVEGNVNVRATFRLEQKMAIPMTGSDLRCGFVVELCRTNAQAVLALACYTGQKRDIAKALRFVPA